MRNLIWLGLIPLGSCGAVQAQNDESCGPQSGLCWPVVKRGASGPRVVALQYLLRAKGIKLAPDGRFGFSTESALRKFQAKNRLQVDGKIGWQSWEALTPSLEKGFRSDGVRALQTLLNSKGKKVARDGIFGSATQKALASFQKPLGLASNSGTDGSTADDWVWCYLCGGGSAVGD
jgi:peptidoglycan hydrolase-like protein with peptidoglycan-binding domain